jgi:hypothetical protein
MGREHSVIDEQVLVGTGDERGAAREEVERVEVEVGGAVVPRCLSVKLTRPSGRSRRRSSAIGGRAQ